MCLRIRPGPRRVRRFRPSSLADGEVPVSTRAGVSSPRGSNHVRAKPQRRRSASTLSIQPTGAHVVSAVHHRALEHARTETAQPRVRRAATLPFDVVESKLHVPALRSGTVSRTGLVNQLRAQRDVSVATITAPAGYGKTTLLAQWSVRGSRPFAWVSIDERDNDPIVLLRHVAAAMHAIQRLDESVLDALATPGPSIWAAAIPRLGSALSAFDEN